ncbi:WYL domain-containing protein [Salinimicrobium catena]|uniref:helix-turn-helix transcriptional regulator n=1 Tax=Salinimicrobium catena TaxID=390640 RepID=UPI002FE47332
MSVRQTIKRHFKIISLLKTRPLSFEELQDIMSNDPDCIEENMLTSQRTFQRDLVDIDSIYGIKIKSDRSHNRYHILEDHEDEHSQRLRENFEILNAIRLSKSLGNNLIFEKRKSLGTEHMAGLLHAIQNNLQVEFTYKKYYDGSESSRKLRPIALKEAQNRWYLVASDTKDDDHIKNFGLDRISDLRITATKFRPVKEYNIEADFRYSFGIINGTDEDAEEVLLSFTPNEGRYVKSLPLHHSQKLVLENKKEVQFSYYIRPTFDFKMELLSYGDQVKVLKPESLKKAIKTQLQQALKSYK